MRGDLRGKGKASGGSRRRCTPQRGQKPTGPAAPIDDVMLREYLLDALAPEVSARVEKALRDSAELRAPTGRCSPEPGRRPVAHLGRDLASHPLDLPQPPATGQLSARSTRPRARLVPDISHRSRRVPVLQSQSRRPENANPDRDRRLRLQDPPAPHSFSRASTC